MVGGIPHWNVDSLNPFIDKLESFEDKKRKELKGTHHNQNLKINNANLAHEQYNLQPSPKKTDVLIG